MKQNLLYALKRTFPIMAGFFPLGMAYGIMMANAGYNFLWTFFTCVTVLAGSLQFLMLNFFAGGTPLWAVAVMALLLNSRHIFYGLPFLRSFKGYGRWRYFLIYTLADENFSLLCSYKPLPGTDEKTVNVMSSALVATYWTAFSTLGSLVGNLISWNTEGVDFALTALFLVILMDQMREGGSRLPAGIAALSGVGCILLFGSDQFLLPSLLVTVGVLLLLRARLEPTLRPSAGTAKEVL